MEVHSAQNPSGGDARAAAVRPSQSALGDVIEGEGKPTSKPVVQEVQTQWDNSVPREIEIVIDVKKTWAKLLDVECARPTSQQVSGEEIWLVDRLFSAAECSAFINQAEEHGFGRTNYPKSYRGNLRLLVTDHSLADAVWERIKPLVPATLSCDGKTWDALGLNEQWRLAKYHPGDRFQQHCDASFARSAREQSMFTVNIYMNEDFEGGSTRFYSKRDQKDADLSVVPKTGLGLIFRQPPGQDYLHDGEMVRSGVKYLFRSDVMYMRRD